MASVHDGRGHKNPVRRLTGIESMPAVPRELVDTRLLERRIATVLGQHEAQELARDNEVVVPRRVISVSPGMCVQLCDGHERLRHPADQDGEVGGVNAKVSPPVVLPGNAHHRCNRALGGADAVPVQPRLDLAIRVCAEKRNAATPDLLGEEQQPRRRRQRGPR